MLYAAYYGKPQIIDILINKGSDIKVYNNNKFNSLHLAAQNNKVSTLIYFKDQLDINETDYNGVTPLHWACINGS